MELSKKSKPELIEEIKRLREKIASNAIHFPGLSVINKFESKIIEKENLVKKTIDQASDAIFITDNKGRFIEVNEKAVEISGYSKQEIDGNLYDKLFKKVSISAEIFETVLTSKESAEIPVEISTKKFDDGRQQYIVRDISRRIEFEKALIESESRWRSIFESSPDTIMLLDLNGNIININHVAKGYNCDEVIGTSYTKYVHSDWLPLMVGSFDELLKTHKPQFFEVKHLTESGTLTWYFIRISPLLEDDKIKSVIAIITNISDHRRSLEHLMKSEERFKKLSESSFEGILIHKDGIILEANDAFYTMFGYEPGEIAGKSALMLAAPESYDLVKNNIITGYEKPYEAVGVKKDGTKIIAELSGKSIPYENGRARVAVLRDITALRQHEEALFQSERQYRLLFEQNPLPIWLCSVDSAEIINVNNAALDHYGFKSKEVIGKSLTKIFDKNEYKKFLEFIQNWDKQSQLVSEFIHVKADNQKIFVRITVQGFSSSDQKLYLLIAQDITEKKRAEQLKIESEARLRSHNKVLVELTKEVTTQKLEMNELLKVIAFNSCKTLNNSTTSVWLWSEKNNLLECKVQYESGSDAYKEGLVLKKKEHPAYFKSLENDRIINVFDVLIDKRTQSFRDSYSIPYDVHSLMDVPIRINGKLLGVVCFEQKSYNRNWLIEEQNFAVSIADLIVISIEAEQKHQAEQALIESESRFRMLAENAIDIVFQYQLVPTARYTYVSPSVETITGYTPEQFYNDPYLGYSIIHPEDRHILERSERFIKMGMRSLTMKESWIDIRWIKRNGEIIWTETRNKPIYKDGKLVAIEGISRDVTKKRNVEESLKESEQRFRLLSEVALEGILITEGIRILDVNNRFLKIFGYTQDEAFSMELNDFMLNNKLEVSNLPNHKSEIKSKTKQGDLIYLEVSSSQMPYEGRHVNVFVFTDITERKKYEYELELSRENYKAFIESSPDALFIQDKEGRVIYANPSALKIIGVEDISSLGTQFIYDFIIEEYHELVRQRQLMVDEGKSVPFIEFRIKRPDGSIAEIESKPISFNYQGKDCYLIFCHDISYQRQLEKEQLRAEIAEEANRRLQLEIAEHRKTQKKLVDTERYAHNIIDSSLDMICAADVNGIITEFNRAAQLCFGYKPEEIIGQPIEILYANKEDYIQRADEINDQGLFKGEVLNVRKNGEVFISYLTAAALVNEEGVVVGNMGVSRDITKIKQAERELKLSEEKYKAIYNQAYIGIARVGLREGNFIEVNQRLCDILGYTAEELCRMTTWDITHPEDLYTDWPERKKFIKNQENKLSTEKRYVHKKGSTIYANLTISLVRDSNGAPDYFVSVYEDITERKRAEEKIRSSEERYRDLFENATDLIQSIDPSGNILFVNSAWKKTLGYTDEEISKMNAFEIIHPDYRDVCKSVCGRVFTGENIDKVELAFITKANKTILVEGNMNCSFRNGVPHSARGIFRDITERKIAEERIKRSEEQYRAIYNQVYIGIGKIALNGEVLQANQQLCSMLGYDESELLGRKLETFIHPDNLESSRAFHKKIITGEIKNFTTEKKYLHKSGSVIYANRTTNVVYDEKGKPEYLLSVFQDITARKWAEEQIKIQSAKLNSIIESSSHVIWTVDRDIRLTSYNENYYKLIKRLYGLEVFIGFKTNAGEMVSTTEYNNFWNQKYEDVFGHGIPQHFETSFKDKNGYVSWREIFLNPIFDENKKVVEVSGIGHDITEKKIAEEKIRQSLKEKEVLLKEVHHRVKNNLQVISSILNLQSSYVRDKYTLQMLRESQDRIKSMSFIHESLYQTKDFTSINFAEYIVNLSKNLVHSYRVYEGHIELKLKVQPVHLNLDLAIPCGLIINELVSNALKYAFPGNAKGIVSISIVEKKGHISIAIEDNGVGLSKEIDFRNTESLGLQLVNTLVEQINGTITMKVRNGTRYNIKFSKTLQ